MQISQNQNQTSFGINSIKFTSDVAKEAFAKATKKIPSEKMANVLQEIKGMKPKMGPDIDTFIGVHSAGGSGIYLNVKAEGKNNIHNIGTTFSEIFKEESVVTPKTLLKAFKKLVKNVDTARMEKFDGSKLPDDLLQKAAKKIK